MEDTWHTGWLRFTSDDQMVEQLTKTGRDIVDLVLETPQHLKLIQTYSQSCLYISMIQVCCPIALSEFFFFLLLIQL